MPQQEKRTQLSDQEELSKELIWSILVELGQQERHFNELESRYRTLASSWLLATFGGLGLVATQDVRIDAPRELIMALLAFGGAGGIFLLWNLDIMVYHRLLDACFLNGVLLEDRIGWLPKFRTEMLQSAPKAGGVLRRIIYFYIGSIAILYFFGALLVSLWARGVLGAWVWTAVLPATGFFWAVARKMRSQSLAKSSGWRKVETRGLINDTI